MDSLLDNTTASFKNAILFSISYESEREFCHGT